MNPRIRTVKPELFKHEALFELERRTQLPVRLAFIALLGCCDREGRFEWRPKRLQLDMLPYDEDIDLSAILNALWQGGFIEQYTHERALYGYIPSWLAHQRINNREPESVLPPPPSQTLIDAHEPTPATLIAQGIHSTSALLWPHSDPVCKEPDACMSNADARISGREMEMEGEEEKEGKWNGREGRDLVARNVRPCSDSESIHQVFEYWKNLMQHPQAQLDLKRKTLISTALKIGYSVEALCKAILGCSLTPHNQGQNDRGQRYDGLHVILRDSDQIDRFIHNAEHPPRLLNESERRLQGNVARLEAWIQEKTEEHLIHETH